MRWIFFLLFSLVWHSLIQFGGKKQKMKSIFMFSKDEKLSEVEKYFNLASMNTKHTNQKYRDFGRTVKFCAPIFILFHRRLRRKCHIRHIGRSCFTVESEMCVRGKSSVSTQPLWPKYGSIVAYNGSFAYCMFKANKRTKPHQIGHLCSPCKYLLCYVVLIME